MSERVESVVSSIMEATPGARAGVLATALAEDDGLGPALAALAGDDAASLVRALVEAVDDGGGPSRARLALGACLSMLGDPRLAEPSDDAYWVALTGPDGTDFQIGRYPVTNAEFRAFVEAGGYEDDRLWTAEGRAWRDATDALWPALAARPDVEAFIAANQPVVGVSAFEAEAFAAKHGARLPTWAERVHAVRGEARRPYPWGSPFGEGHANTREEALERPCAVGLYRGDCTPEGVFDLAGNAGEWTAEQVGDERLLHPGSWERPSLASWAKASTTAPPGARWSAQGFRLAR